jgi:hypothetical protein
MSDLEKGLKEEIRKYLLVLDDIEKFNNKHGLYLQTLQDNIFSYMKLLGIDSYGKIKKETVKSFHPREISNIKEIFNDPDMVDNLVVKVMPELTLRNLKIKNGLSDKLANSYMDIVNDLMADTHERLVVKK